MAANSRVSIQSPLSKIRVQIILFESRRDRHHCQGFESAIYVDQENDQAIYTERQRK
ncbi:hypothetical protein Ccrd_026115 [Cynara cardunculus var. scolymus]|uniref:Uncharacterized protein n=1 Tax=Cynara cardunculus var. scolymus TaxID=59895 RepID=A0A118I802_CYNCS|nr:hypothetical protein Ccrd_026115 [Cynara cardunculus var. scolymus]